MQRDVTVAKGRLFKAMNVTASLLHADTIECEYITEGLNILPGTRPAFLVADIALLCVAVSYKINLIWAKSAVFDLTYKSVTVRVLG